MSFEEKIKLRQNDYGYDLEFQIIQKNGNPFDLTNATVTIFIYEEKASTSKIVRTATITDAANGICKITLQEGDFNEGDKRYLVDAQINFGGGPITQVESAEIYVRSAPPPPA